MFYISKIDDYLKILSNEEVKDLAAISSSEYFTSTRKNLYFKLNEDQNLRKVAN